MDSVPLVAEAEVLDGGLEGRVVVEADVSV